MKLTQKLVLIQSSFKTQASHLSMIKCTTHVKSIWYISLVDLVSCIHHSKMSRNSMQVTVLKYHACKSIHSGRSLQLGKYHCSQVFIFGTQLLLSRLWSLTLHIREVSFTLHSVLMGKSQCLLEWTVYTASRCFNGSKIEQLLLGIQVTRQFLH